MRDGEAFRRFIREARLLSPPVAAWLSAVVQKGLPLARRRAIRDHLIAEAARRLPGPLWTRARRIAFLARNPGPADADTPAGLVSLALRVYRAGERPDRAPSAAQVFRLFTCILGFTCKSESSETPAQEDKTA